MDEFMRQLYTKADICAIIVTYNCDQRIQENIRILSTQVAKILIIDNGSIFESLSYLSQMSRLSNVEILYNNCNEGIASALNTGLRYCKKNNYKLYLTLDQDTTFLNNTVEELLEVLNENEYIVSVGPVYSKYIDNSRYWKTSFVNVKYLITSGSLTLTRIALDVNGYNDELFIDGVDFDFSLSIRRINDNYKIVMASKAIMLHSIGEKWMVFRFGHFRCYSNIHNPVRCYYMTRNHYYVLRKYWKFVPILCIKKEALHILHIIKVILFYPKKKECIRMIVSGIIDAKKHNYGKYSK